MIRTIVSLDEEIKSWLDIRARREGVPMSELVRRALRELRAKEERSVDAILQGTGGIWTRGDGLEYQESERKLWKGE